MITIKQFEEMPVCVIFPYLKEVLGENAYFIPWTRYLPKFQKRLKDGELGMLHGMRYFLNKKMKTK